MSLLTLICQNPQYFAYEFKGIVHVSLVIFLKVIFALK
jgi:hypothetical protein